MRIALATLQGFVCWPKVTSKFPNWEKAFGGLDKSALHATLVSIGVDPAQSLDLADALLDHFTFKDDLAWPTLFDPAACLPKSTALAWVCTTNGPWCFSDDEDRMVRQVYEEVWKRFEEVRKAPGRKKGLLIKGHPGIGKSYLLDLLLSWSLFTQPTVPVIAIAVQGFHIFINTDGKTPKRIFVRRHDAFRFPDLLIKFGVKEGSELVVLHDIKSSPELPFQGELLGNLFLNFKVTCVVASSPDQKNFAGFRKACTNCFRLFILPTLTFDEARAFTKHMNQNVSDATFAEWFDIVGGVPRHLTSQEEVDIVAASQKSSAPRVMFDPISSGTDRETNKIIQAVPHGDYRGETFDFISNNACREWMKKQDASNSSRLLQRLRECKESGIRDALGRFFENWVISKLQKGETFCRMSLEKQGAVLERWDLPSSLTVARFPGDEPKKIESTAQDMLWVPYSSKFPVVDCVITRAKPAPTGTAAVEATLIQVTVASEHRPKQAPTEQLFKALEANNIKRVEFVWVVDSQSTLNKKQALASGGSCAAYDSTPQYLCRVDDHMCWVQLKGTAKGTAVCFPCDPMATELTILDQVKKLVDPKAKKLTNFNQGTIGSEAAPLIYE